ncbi:U-scoloptoxin(19)-Sm1a isoform X1 [Cylas formicarius]|uniref:U-scoloptoxin(19)-Sm1a isoform X1 n=1 Tax=Cylas formicarius TaxID=197179 RepID=UPI0029584235|nr:U-scoloptoxin(19)-Sm1a isoform X1 [Cylas formicarius]
MGQLFRFVIVVVVGSVWCSEEIQSNFYREEPCAAQQGYCVLENECPTSPTDQLRSLCPGQKNAGAVCCKNFPQQKLNCFQLHNDCRDTCPPNLNLGRKGCPTGTSCCVLV